MHATAILCILFFGDTSVFVSYCSLVMLLCGNFDISSIRNRYTQQGGMRLY